ncbi:MAG: NUDIX hydrolase [Phycisphaerae bacterium]|nr:NUDIX hydrolase [Phycisphaerae bacterium]NUQ44731.1 NUDIX hydrolase [Phycisphaerae bacterium]
MGRPRLPTHRGLLLAKLARYRAIDAGDAAACREIAAFVRTHKRCFDTAYAPGHVTGSAWLLDASGTRVLLTHHRRLGRWIQLGGHADGDPDLLAVALREAREESGIDAVEPLSEDIFDVGVHGTPGHDGLAAHRHYDIRFLLQVRGDGRYVVSDESHALGWFTFDGLAAMDVDDAVRRMSLKWRRMLDNGSGANAALAAVRSAPRMLTEH